MSQHTYHPIAFSNYPVAWEERWNFLRYFIDCWFAPVLETDGYSKIALQQLEQKLGSRLPDALLSVLEYCGCRRDIWQFLTEGKTLFQKLERVGDAVVVDSVVPLYAYSALEDSIDPDLFFWDSRNKRLTDRVGKLSDCLFDNVVQSLWNGKGTERIPYFTKQVRLEPEEVKIGANGEWLQKQEVAGRLICSPESGIAGISYHGRDLVVTTCYPNSFRVAAREMSALEVLPTWLREKLARDEDILNAYDFYRHVGS